MGQVSVEDHMVHDIFGTHVNLASRVMALAKAGQIIVSGSVWENASGWLKDEEDGNVQSVYYGKIKLKGIGKPTDIYEFYHKKSGKLGIPSPLLKNKQKKRILRIGIFTLLVILSGILLFFLFNPSSNDISETIENQREILVLTDIDSYNEDIEYTVNVLSAFNKTNYVEDGEFILEPIDTSTILRLNEEYYQLLKTKFIVDFDIITETDLEREYAKKGLIVPSNMTEDTILKQNTFKRSQQYFVVMPHLYKHINDNYYYLVIVNFNSFYSYITYYIDSVPYIIEEYTRSLTNSPKKEFYFQGTIINISDNQVIIKIEKKAKRILPGIILKTGRYYAGRYQDINDSAVKRRFIDLEKVVKYFNNDIIEWNKHIDSTEVYFWSHSEYLEMQNSHVRFKSSGGLELDLYTELKVIEVYDSTALAKIHYQKYPWAKIKVGDQVRLK